MKEKGIEYIYTEHNDAIALTRIAGWKAFADLVAELVERSGEPVAEVVEAIKAEAPGFVLELDIYRSIT